MTISNYSGQKNRRYKKPTFPKKFKASKGSGLISKISENRLLIATYLASFTLFGILFGTIAALVIFAFFARELPSPNTLLDRDEELSTIIYDKNNTPIYEVFGEKNRSLIKIDQVSPHLLHATLATEDSDFYHHQGFDFLAYARAIKNIAFGEGLQGGSTLTQQVIKNTLLSQERTITRKIKELILSLQLENRYTKDEILQMYLNETPYGGQNYGVLTASKYYFDKSPKDLTIAESAYIAGLPQSPSRYSYYSSDPQLGLDRKDYVLYLMLERGWLTKDGKRQKLSKEEYDAAKLEKLKFKRAAASFEAPHFVFYVKELLEERLGKDIVEQGGLQVTTTLDLDLQKTAQKIVKDEIDASTGLNVGNGAMVAINPKNGHILAMIGSKDYFAESEPKDCISGITGDNSCTFEPALNVALAKRQPGSSIKPLTYVTMLENGFTASFPFLDVPTTFINDDTNNKAYTPVNYDGTYRGVMSLRRSLANSLNVTAVKALQIVGIDNMIETAQRLGITTLNDRSRFGLALTLGGGETRLLEMTGAFSAFANKGEFHAPVAITEIKNAKGQTIYKWRETKGSQAITQESAFLISDILSDDGARSAAFGTGSLLNIPGHDVAVKTGTTDDKRDNYAIGYTPSIVAGVWVGNNNNDAMNPGVASGLTGATPIWNTFMSTYLKDKKAENFETPKKVKKLEVDSLTGMLPYRDNPKRSEWFTEGTEPTAVSDWYQRLEICKVDGKIANDACKEADRTETKTFIRITAELPEWQPAVDKWVEKAYSDKEEYFPPSSTSKLQFDEDGDVEGDVDPSIDIIGLKDGDRVPLSFRLAVDAFSPNDIEVVSFYVDGKKVGEDKSKPYGFPFEFSADDVGEHEFMIKAKDEDDRDAEKKIRLRVTD